MEGEQEHRKGARGSTWWGSGSRIFRRRLFGALGFIGLSGFRGFRVLGFRVWGLGFRVWGLGFGVEGLGFRV